jgi:hypothetical protein
MACTTCLVCLVSPVMAAAKKHSEKQVQVAGKQDGKQGRWTDQAGRVTWQSRQSWLPSLFQACLLCFAPDTSAHVVDISQT